MPVCDEKGYLPGMRPQHSLVRPKTTGDKTGSPCYSATTTLSRELLSSTTTSSLVLIWCSILHSFESYQAKHEEQASLDRYEIDSQRLLQ